VRPSSSSSSSSRERAWPALDGLRILIVEDDADTRAAIPMLLEGTGVAVRTAGTAQEALEHIEEWRPHVLVSDISLPTMDGYELVRRVRAGDGERGFATPAVALTGYADQKHRQLCFDAGFQAHVAKPIDPIELVTVIASLAGRGPGRARDPHARDPHARRPPLPPPPLSA
jgi:CheY-like chemotaxis protein